MSEFTGSRFANPHRVDVLSLGPCRCPDRRKEAGSHPGTERRVEDRGRPHDEDQVVHRLELGGGEEAQIGAYGMSVTEGKYFDWEASRNKLIEIGVVRWNILGPEGQPMPVTAASAALLDEETRELICTTLDRVLEEGRKPLPKAPAGRSAGGSRATGSRTRKTRKPG